MEESALSETAIRLVGNYLKTADTRLPNGSDADRALLALAIACQDRAEAMGGDLSDEWLATGKEYE